MAKQRKRNDVVVEARERYRRAKEHWGPIYDEARSDMRFSDPTAPQQWDERVKRERENSAGGPRPVLIFDQTMQFVRQVLNTARRNKPALKYLPVDDESDPQAAEILQGLARQCEYESRADVAYIGALMQAARGGIGWFRLRLIEDDTSPIEGQLAARIERVTEFESVLADPDFIQPDGSDMRWGFVTETVSRAAFERRYPKASFSSFDDDGWFGEDSVRIAEYYRLADGKVEVFTLTGEQVLESGEFPGDHVPLFCVLGNEEWDEGKRRLSGCVRMARDPQVAYNLERNLAIETTALSPKAPWLAPIEAIQGLEAHWKQANRGNLAYLPYNTLDESGNPIPAKPERIAPAMIAAGFVDLAERSKSDIQSALGAYEASAGNNPNNQSGRAVIALQERADVGTFHYVDNLALAISHLGRVLSKVWPYIYDVPQVIRIIGEDDEPDYVRVDPELPQPVGEVPGPRGPQLAFNPGVGRYDVRAVVGPAFSTRQTEAAAEIGELVNGNPQMFALLGDVWVKMRNMPEGDKIARRLQAMLPPAVRAAEGEGEAPLPPEVQQVLMQAQQEIAALRTQLQEAQSGLQKAMIDAQSRAQVAQINAEARFDEATLNALADLIKAKIQPPPALAAEVGEDFAK